MYYGENVKPQTKVDRYDAISYLNYNHIIIPQSNAIQSLLHFAKLAKAAEPSMIETVQHMKVKHMMADWDISLKDMAIGRQKRIINFLPTPK